MRGRRNRTSEQQTYIDELRKKVESGEMTREEAGEQYRRSFRIRNRTTNAASDSNTRTP